MIKKSKIPRQQRVFCTIVLHIGRPVGELHLTTHLYEVTPEATHSMHQARNDLVAALERAVEAFEQKGLMLTSVQKKPVRFTRVRRS